MKYDFQKNKFSLTQVQISLTKENFLRQTFLANGYLSFSNMLNDRIVVSVKVENATEIEQVQNIAFMVDMMWSKQINNINAKNLGCIHFEINY